MPLPSGPKQRRQTGRTGNSSLAYLGVLPESPTNFVQFTKDPTPSDYKNWYVGDEWENSVTKDIFKLVNVTGKIATWVKFVTGTGDVSTLKDNAGTVVYPDSGGSITIKAGEMIDTTASANTVEVSLSRGLLNGQIPIAAMGGATQYANITPGANVTITEGPNSITIASAAGAGGEITIVGDAGSTATSVGNVVNVVGTANKITATGNMGQTLTLTTGASVPTSFATGAGSAVPAAGVLTVAGTANKIVTTGAGSTVTLTTGASVPTSFTTGTGSAVPAAGVLTVAGGQNTNTTGAGSTVTVNMKSTYQVAVAAGTLEIGTVDATQKLGSVSIAALKVLLGLP